MMIDTGRTGTVNSPNEEKRNGKSLDNSDDHYDDWGNDYSYYYDDIESDESESSFPRINFAKYSKSSNMSDGAGLPKTIYCDLVETFNEKCLEHSLLAIWR